jgi:S1-C subfamily serine protease
VNRGLSTLALVALLGAGIAAGVGLAARLDGGAGSDPRSLDAALTLQSTFNRAAAVATQAVVHITTSEDSNFNGNVGSGDNVGSGVIVTREGHLVTNYHVIRGARGCRVRFVDGSEYTGVVVGMDLESDLAVVKIDAGGKELTPIVFADSDRARVGDVVFAIGSPFGYTHTVTSGIVSAKHRRLEFGKPYEDYLQTDAAINPGNSGGALVNLKGELVGLNTAIVSRNRASDGVGLAIASNLVKWVQERLIRDGVVRRGYLGITPMDLDLKSLEHNGLGSDPVLGGARTPEELARKLKLRDTSGVLIVGVKPASPAARVGLRPYDVIVEFDGRPVRNRHEFFFQVAEVAPGRTIRLKYRREGKLIEAEVVLAERVPDLRPDPFPPETPK